MRSLFQSKKQFAAALSVGFNLLLITLKITVGLVTGSIAVLASAIDSLIDVVTSVLAFFAMDLADSPPDEDHPFGHGKFEDFAGLLQAILIMLGAVFILYEAVPKLLHPSTIQINPVPGLIVMVFSIVTGFLVSRHLLKVAKETESPALEADAHHLGADVITSIAVIIGLVLVRISGNPIFDPIIGLFVAVLILVVGIRIIRTVFQHLTDKVLPAEEEKQIIEIILNTMPTGEPVKITDLKTRRSGSHRLIVFNLQVNPELTVKQAHHYCDMIEAALEKTFQNSLVNIHLEPLSMVTSS